MVEAFCILRRPILQERSISSRKLWSFLFCITHLLTWESGGSSAFLIAPDKTTGRITFQQMAVSSSSPFSASSSLFPSNEPSSNNIASGLSKIHQGILSRTSDRQRFVSGKYPLLVTITENPTLKWLNLGRRDGYPEGTCQLLVNGTSVGKSVASYDRFQWLDDEERAELHNSYALVSIELLGEINLEKPGYINVLTNQGAGSSAAKLRRNSESNESWDTRWKRLNAWTNAWSEEENINDDSIIDKGQCSDNISSSSRGDRVWVTGFSLAGRSGLLNSIDTNVGHIESVSSRTGRSILWPNEVTYVPSQWVGTATEVTKDKDQKLATTSTKQSIQDALLVCDGFLVPGKDRGGLYLVKNPGNPHTEWSFCLTSGIGKWFYHRAVWIDLTGDGRKSILTARAFLPSVLSGTKGKANAPKCGQLVWLEMPKPYKFDEVTGVPLDKDGTIFDPLSSKHLPWKEHVLVEGPDVMFNVADLDTDDNTVEVISSQFFGEQVTVHSIEIGPEPRVSFSRVIDDSCGAAFGCILSNLDDKESGDTTTRKVVDSGSTVETLKPGDCFSHLLVTSHECSFADDVKQLENEDSSSVTDPSPELSSRKKHQSSSTSGLDGGSLFAYRIPKGRGRWKTDEWIRTTVATGFKVQGQLGNVINPGAPGFVYTFYANKNDEDIRGKRPMIAVAGDCAESAYLFRPEEGKVTADTASNDPSAQYKLMCEIECGATVGSIGIGYDNFCVEDQEKGYAKLYIPCYEKDKILVFSLGSGDYEVDTGDDW